MRTHLSAIVSLTDLIRKSKDAEKTAALIEALHFAASNAMTMVEGGTEINRQPQQDSILLSCWLKEFESLANILASSQGSRFALELDTALEREAPMAPSPGYLHRTLMLLLDNTLKYATGATISLKASLKTFPTARPQLELILSDDGPGFRNQDPELLFEPYHRGEEQGDSEGKGLGLWSARHILSVMGGTITAQEIAPHGARFTIRLPIEETTGQTAASTNDGTPCPALPEREEPSPEKAEILIVDDNKTNLLILTEILKSLGFSPIAAQSGKQALELLKSSRPALAIFDIRMEDMSGWDLLEHVKSNQTFESLPVIAVSADDAPTEIAPFRAWLKRPIQPDSLYTLLTNHLSRT